MVEFLRHGRDNPFATFIDEMAAQADDEVSSGACTCGSQVSDLENFFTPRRHYGMRAQQRFDGSIEISFQEQCLLRRSPVAGGGDNASLALQTDQRGREVEHHGLIAEGVDPTDQSLHVTSARGGLVVN
jgi:hypothetical protein